METAFTIFVAIGVLFGLGKFAMWLFTFSPKDDREEREYSARLRGEDAQ